MGYCRERLGRVCYGGVGLGVVSNEIDYIISRCGLSGYREVLFGKVCHGSVWRGIARHCREWYCKVRIIVQNNYATWFGDVKSCEARLSIVGSGRERLGFAR